MTNLPREPIHIASWPDGKKVAICFVLYVEEWGVGQGPTLRTDTMSRKPDLVNESFRQYAINWGIERVGKLFNEQGVPLSIALNALFPQIHPDVWRTFPLLCPKSSYHCSWPQQYHKELASARPRAERARGVYP